MSFISFPAEIKEYQVEVSKDEVRIWLKGVPHLPGGGSAVGRTMHAGRIDFSIDDSGDHDDGFDRGGGLRMHRPMSMLSAIVDLLRNEKPLFLSKKGVLSTSAEPVGEDEDE